MPQNIEGWNKNYENIESSCDEASCAPCTYPNCQRFVKERKVGKRAFRK